MQELFTSRVLGLPVGVQLATRLWGDDDLLDIARELDFLIGNFRRFDASPDAL